ncbi:MAG: hypothetical protein KBT69_01450, partial [Oceanihabitans sp.]|nr:hypothetical protein [Oceanihabitans sp.]
MKKLLLITVAFLFCGNVFSQIEIVKESEMTMDQMLEKVDKAKFTSGILMDRSQNYSNISQLNTQEKVVSINYSYFKQALLDLYNASNKKMFISSKSLKDGFKNKKREDNIVDFGIISADFESLNYNPNDESLGGLKLVNGKFEQQKDKEAFISHTALVISPLKIAAKGNVITYRFNNEFWFNNSEKT